MSSDRRSDRLAVLYVADLSSGRGGAERLADELAALVDAGLAVGLRPPSWPPGAQLVPVARSLVARGEVRLVLPGEPADAPVLVVDAASAISASLEGVSAGRVAVVVGQEAASGMLDLLASRAPEVLRRGLEWPLVVATASPRLHVRDDESLLGVVLPSRPDQRLRLVRALRSLPDGWRPAVWDRRPPRGWLRLPAATSADQVAGTDALVVPAGRDGDRLRELAAAGGRLALDDADVLATPTVLRRLSEAAPPSDAHGSGAAELVRLVRSWLGEPASEPAQPHHSGTSAARTRPVGATVLYVSSNGAGMGHLTRLMAMARRADPRVQPLFLSMSSAVPVVAAEGFGYEYVPSRDDLGIGPRRWNVSFAQRFAEVLRREQPAAVVFDGTFPYDGLFVARETLPGVRLVWSRRGMWQPGRGGPALSRAGRFDLVVEPGELAAARDQGATASRTDALRVAPVTLLDRDELLPRAEAAAVLGLDPARPAALVTRGAGNINDITSDLGLIVSGLLDVADLQVVVTRPVIAAGGHAPSDRVHGVSVYPISRYLTAIDLAVAASGYNSFHELVQFGVPTAWVPNTSTALDDQRGRASWAEDAGVGIEVDEVTPAAVARIATELGDPVRRGSLASACRAAARPNGAAAAQQAIEALVGLETSAPARGLRSAAVSTAAGQATT